MKFDTASAKEYKLCQKRSLRGDTNVQNRDDPGEAFEHALPALETADVLFGNMEMPLHEEAEFEHVEIDLKTGEFVTNRQEQSKERTR